VILESAFSHEPHEYLRDTLDLKYRECNSCANRTEFTCVKCGFCWSCHWKIEQAEKFELFDRSIGIDRLAPPFSLYSHSMTVKEKGNEEKEKEEKHLSKEMSNYRLTTKAIDVFGKEIEPICDYLRCHHKFSVHGISTYKCRCKHPQNEVIGA
jgi:hypothetical protein